MLPWSLLTDVAKMNAETCSLLRSLANAYKVIGETQT